MSTTGEMGDIDMAKKRGRGRSARGTDIRPVSKKKSKRRFHNPPPVGDIPGGFEPSPLKAEFGRRLQHALTEKGWNQSDLAREATRHMPGKQRFGRDNISNYVRGKQIPGPVRLRALCDALGMPATDLVPPGAVNTVSGINVPLEVKSAGEGRMLLRVNQVIPTDMAMRIIALLGQFDIVKDNQ